MGHYFKIAAALLVAGLALASTAQAQTTQWLYWNQTTADWVDVTANWTCTYPSGNPSAVPGDGDMAIIKTAGTVNVDATHVFAGSPAEIWVGDGAGIDTSIEPYSPYEPGAGSLLQVGGTVNFGNHLYVGHGSAPGTSTYEIQDGSLIQTGVGKSVIGYAGATGEMTVSGTVLDPAIIELHGDLQIGFDSPTSVGKLSMSGESSLTIDSGQFQLGSVGGTGTLEMSGNASIDSTSATVFIGIFSSANATLDMSGYSSFTATNTYVAYDIVESSSITLDDNATYTNNGNFYVGYNGTPGYPRTDIDITVAGNATLQTATMYMGLYKGSDATVLVSSDSATPTDTAKLIVYDSFCIGFLGGYGDLTVGDRGVVTHGSAGNIYVGHGIHDLIVVGSGAVTIESGGTFDNTSSTGTVNIGGEGSVGSWTQNGGSMLNAQGVYLGYDAGTGTLNLNGGVFKAAFIRSDDTTSAPVSSIVNFNGGTLRAAADDTNFVGDTGTTSYLVANVQSGGAVIDTNGFNVTITSALTEDAGDIGGGLTKQGIGNLTIDAACSYTGDTTVTAGTLTTNNNSVLADEASLILAVGAVLELNFAAGTSDTIGGLWLGGTEMTAEGTYGTVASGADYQNDTYFAGTGWVLLELGGGPTVPGDTNGDDIVNETDAAVLADNWGIAVTGGFGDGDFNDDNFVNAIDAAILAANWGNHAGSEESPVPEPGAISLLMLGMVSLIIRRKR
ncbi:MAG: PEP-CTERM sorting domain-containing protein [Pirellulales bacterium]|nr:PEP-CTERM sorting domain-containing protein [Pirellulales bacterium]